MGPYIGLGSARQSVAWLGPARLGRQDVIVMAAECRARTAGEQRAHLAAIEKIVARWQDGQIDITEKRELIARENSFYHGQIARGRTGRVLTAVSAGNDSRERGEGSGGHWWQDD